MECACGMSGKIMSLTSFILVQIHFKTEVFGPESLPDTATKHCLQLKYHGRGREGDAISLAVEYHIVKLRK